MTVTSGRRCSALLKLSGQGGSLARMSEILFQWKWASSAAFLTWKMQVMPSKRFYWALSVSAPRTEGTESGLWQTPNANEDRAECYTLETSYRHAQEGRQIHLAQEVRDNRLWPTPSAHKITQSGEIVDAQGSTWTGRGKPHSKNTGAPIQTALTDAVKMWPTPKGSPSGPDFARAGREKSGGDDLATVVAMAGGGSLNPTWVEWLMGYPPEWTALNASATPSSRKFPRSLAAVSSRRRG